MCIQRRAVSSSIRTLATTASPSPIASTSAAGASAVPHRPRLERLRAESAQIDDFLGPDPISNSPRERIVFAKNKTCAVSHYLWTCLSCTVRADDAPTVLGCRATSRPRSPPRPATTRSSKICVDSSCTPCAKRRAAPTSDNAGVVTRETQLQPSWSVRAILETVARKSVGHADKAYLSRSRSSWETRALVAADSAPSKHPALRHLSMCTSRRTRQRRSRDGASDTSS